MIDALLAEITDRGYRLHYLRGPDPWEASISRPLPDQTPLGYVNAVGYGSGPTPALTLDEALDRVENDFERITSQPASNFNFPTTPTLNLTALLTNLRPKTQVNFRGKL